MTKPTFSELLEITYLGVCVDGVTTEIKFENIYYLSDLLYILKFVFTLPFRLEKRSAKMVDGAC